MVRKLRFFSSIRTKFAITYFLVIAFVLILMNTYFLMASREMMFTSKQVFLQNQASFVAAHLEASFITLSPDDDIDRVMEELDVAAATFVVITDAEGFVLYDSSENRSEDEFPAENIQRTLESYEVFYTMFSEGVFSSSAFAPIVSRGEIIGAVFVHEDDPEQGAILSDMQSTLWNISIIVAIFSVFAVTFIVWSMMRRVGSIVKAVKSVREGQYSYHIKMGGNDELAILGDEFNSLTNRLRETDEVRRRFVADASHELRTPLATIRLLSDSILQNVDIRRDTVHEFISDIGTEAGRLARTTEKLMTLTKLDSDIPDERIRVDMRTAVQATLRMLTPLADSHGLLLRSELAEGCFVLATEDAIHQIAFNLIENAIKYNLPGGGVNVGLGIVDDMVVLNVDDRGVGVPDEDIPYIFDRFYRVDKARSRAAGGSGLGLSIVSDTVRELGGNVTAARRVGGGMRFQVRFALWKDDG